MRDEFYVILPSNSSTNYFVGNTTTHFTTQLPQQISLQGTWCVALTEIQIPLTFQHFSLAEDERKIIVDHIPRIMFSNNTRSEKALEKIIRHVRPGVYSSIQNLLLEINEMDFIRDHLHFKTENGGYVTVKRLCGDDECKEIDHTLQLSEKLKKILGFENTLEIISTGSVTGSRPASLLNVLPNMLMVYSDICEPYVLGDVQTRLLKTVPLNLDRYVYGTIQTKTFSPAMYLPLLFNSFQTIEIDIRDDLGNSVSFDYGTSMVTLHFKKLE